MYGFLGLRLARWGSPALHPRLSKSAAMPLKARCKMTNGTMELLQSKLAPVREQYTLLQEVKPPGNAQCPWRFEDNAMLDLPILPFAVSGGTADFDCR